MTMQAVGGKNSYSDGRKAYHARYYQEHRDVYMRSASKRYETHKQEVRDRNAKVRTGVLQAYGNKCQCCGETTPQFLTVDHIAGGGGAHLKANGLSSGTMFYFWLQKNQYPEGFQLLCWNCNCAKGKYGVCPHQSEVTT